MVSQAYNRINLRHEIIYFIFQFFCVDWEHVHKLPVFVFKLSLNQLKVIIHSLAVSIYLLCFSSKNRNYLNFIIEELIDPVKNLPRAIAISCTLVTIVYVLANVSFYTILSPDEVLGSSAVAVTFAERAFGPFAWTIPGIL